MKSYINIKIICLLCICLYLNNANAQVSNGTNAAVNPNVEYVGWNNGSGGQLMIKNESNNPINFLTNTGVGGTTPVVMTITGAGTVGIGTAAPADKLHVHLPDTFQVIARITNNYSTSGFQIGVQGHGNGNGNAILNMVDNKKLNIYTNDLVRLHIANGTGAGSGYVGIGTGFNSPASRLHITQNSNADSWFQITGNNTGETATDGLRIGVLNSGSFHAEIRQQENADMLFYTNAAERLRILSGGNVGVGLAAPMNLVHQHNAASNSNTYHQFTTNNTGSSNATDGLIVGLKYASGVPNAEFNLQESTGSMNFSTSNTPRMTVLSGGYIGINKTSPIYQLDVDNTANTGDYTANFTNSATGYGVQQIGAITATNMISRSVGVNSGITFRVQGCQMWNFGIDGQADEDDAEVNYGVYATGNRGTKNIGVVGIGANDNNNTGTADYNYGVQGIGRDAGTNYGLHGTGENGTTSYGARCAASNASASNYGVYGIASGGTANYAIYGDVGGGSTQWAGYFNGGTYSAVAVSTSDANLKTNLQDISNGLSIINQLSPKTYEYKTQQQLNSSINLPSGTHAGVIAQDLELVLPELVSDVVQPAKYDDLGNEIYPSLSFKGVNYIELIPYLIQAIKEQQAQIDALTPMAPGNNSQKMNIKLENEEGSILYQNQPNPFKGSTNINYYLPENTGRAMISFYNNQGNLMKEIEITEKGQGSIVVNADNLISDIYTYSLTVDGKIIDTKKMVKIK